MKNPFDKFYHVANSKELLDIAFKRGMKSSAQVSKNAPILIKAKKKESKRIKVAIDVLLDRILKIIKIGSIIVDTTKKPTPIPIEILDNIFNDLCLVSPRRFSKTGRKKIYEVKFNINVF